MSSLFRSATGLDGNVVSRRMAFVLAGSALGGLFIALAAVFATFSGYLALVQHLAPWQAALVVAAVALLIALISLFVAFRQLGRTVDQVHSAVRSSAVALLAPAALRVAARNPKLLASLSALAAGLIAILRVKNRPPAKS